MSLLDARDTAHLMPGEAVPDIVTACRLMQLGVMPHDYPLSGRPVPASPAPTAITPQAPGCAGGAVVRMRLGAAGRCAHPPVRAVHPGATGTSGCREHRPEAEAGAGLAELAYELLDAHTDTAQLVDDLPYDPSWAAHLDYLRALQRTGREMLARTASAAGPFRRPVRSCTPLASADPGRARVGVEAGDQMRRPARRPPIAGGNH